jgi:predicted nucleic acid-binding protein
MKAVFADTAGWVACADRRDQSHAECCAARDSQLKEGKVLVTTDYVVDETLTLLRIRLGTASARQWWETVSSSQRVLMRSVDEELLEAARQWFFRYSDKDFSFTDCTSFVLMKRDRINSALTTDHHFVQAGFMALPGASA